MTDLNEILTEVRQAIDEIGEFDSELVRAQMHADNAIMQLEATGNTTDLGTVTDLLGAAYEEMRQGGEFASNLIGISGYNVTVERLQAVSDEGDIGAATGVLLLGAEETGIAVNIVSDFMALYEKRTDIEIAVLITAARNFKNHLEDAFQSVVGSQALLIAWYPFPLH